MIMTMTMMMMKTEVFWLFLILEGCAGYPGVGTGPDEVRQDGAAAKDKARAASSLQGDAHKSWRDKL